MSEAGRHQLVCVYWEQRRIASVPVTCVRCKSKLAIVAINQWVLSLIEPICPECFIALDEEPGEEMAHGLFGGIPLETDLANSEVRRVCLDLVARHLRDKSRGGEQPA